MGSYFGIKALYKDTTLIFAKEMKLTLSLGTGISKVAYSYTTKTGATGSGTVTSTTTIPAIFFSFFIHELVVYLLGYNYEFHHNNIEWWRRWLRHGRYASSRFFGWNYKGCKIYRYR